jgi:hypothetical protein
MERHILPNGRARDFLYGRPYSHVRNVTLNLHEKCISGLSGNIVLAIFRLFL